MEYHYADIDYVTYSSNSQRNMSLSIIIIITKEED